jgi:acetylglutamate kinase
MIIVPLTKGDGMAAYDYASDWLAKASVLTEALPYMRRFHGEIVVVKFGGHAMGSEELALEFARDIVLLKQLDIHPVVVHGGGPQIKAMLERLQIRSDFVDGLRVTDAATVEVVEMVLAGTINKAIVADIAQAGGVAVGLSGRDGGLIKARKVTRTKVDPDSNIEKVLDLGFVGEPEEVDPHVLHVLTQSDIIPVVAPVGTGPDGQPYNINADTAAGAIAAALKASRLLLLTDVAGVLDKDKNLVTDLTPSDIQSLIDDGTISGGMIPKVETCMDAVKGGVEASVILDGRVPHVILLELFTARGAGTLVRDRALTRPLDD